MQTLLPSLLPEPILPTPHLPWWPNSLKPLAKMTNFLPYIVFSSWAQTVRLAHPPCFC